MEKIHRHSLVSALGIAGITLAVFTSNPSPFRPIDDFVIFGRKGVFVDGNAQTLRGSVGSDDDVSIGKKTAITGDVFGKSVTIRENAIIDGNLFAKKLKLSSGAAILGNQSSAISFPVAVFPDIPDSAFGGGDTTIQASTTQTLLPGMFRDIKIGKKARVTVQPGVYDIRSLEIEKEATLIFEASSTLRIAKEIEIGDGVTFLSPSNMNPSGILFESKTKEEIEIGKNANLIFRLIAPNAKVEIEKESMIWGNVWAKEVKIAGGSVFRDTIWFSIPSDPSDFISVGGAKFLINAFALKLLDTVTFEDAERIAALINGKIIGFEPVTNLYGIQIPTRTVSELETAIQTVNNLNDPKIEGAFKAVVPVFH